MAPSVLAVKGVTDAGLGNLCQQAVEKAIKSVLAAKGTEFPFTHNLERLRDFAEKSRIALPSTLGGIEDLTPFAAAERYGSETPLRLDRDQALTWGTEAIAWARTLIEETDPPQTPPSPS